MKIKIKKIIAYASLFMLSLGLHAQKKISGKTTYNQKPLSGVSVIILKDNSSYLTGVETDSAGNYTIENIKAGSYKLLFSLIGYDKKTIDIKKGINQFFTLVEQQLYFKKESEEFK